ncbi:MAG: hypothetical protein HYT93_04390 [Parcubacteria group bacterium]|nr:hypothetical protein [Parcubacteria group bacterium]
MNRKNLFYFFIICLSLFFAPAISHADTGAYQTKVSCKEILPIAVHNLVKAAFPNQNILHALQAYNDVMCEIPENMANVVITVVKNKEEQFYGTFHLHFKNDGTLPQYLHELARDEKSWTRITAKNDWKKEWCEWMRDVYPQEKNKFGCDMFIYE